ncbi:DUF1566 domain-containing protein [bacterium]|nr:DUF1566 domain-containing protein [bacterium]
MKIRTLISFIIFAMFFISCEKKMDWINPNDSNADSAKIEKTCKENKIECGVVNVSIDGSLGELDCGKCDDGFNCNDENKCIDIDECSDHALNNCPPHSTCANEDGTFSCVCDKNYSGDDCVPDTRLKDCENLPENANWNNASEIDQTWNGYEWYPSNKGTFNEESSTTECRFKCNEHYSWNESKCVADTKTAQCEGLPENAQWNTASEINQTWNGEAWEPSAKGTYSEESSTKECRFKCKNNLEWNGEKCVGATKKTNCTGLPENAVWNTASEIDQTWNGEDWEPSATGTYNEESSSTECRFKCDTNYNWSASASKCVAATKDSSCTGLPQNATWNTAESITQTWSGSEWLPSTTGTWNTAASTSECRFKCNEHYNWNSSDKTCDAATQPGTCSTKPANTVWNDGGANGTFTQIWTGSGWTPASYASEYGTDEGTCHYKCDSTHTWENGSCINQKTATCPDKPENTVWNDGGANGTYTQNWSSSNGWTPNYTSAYSTTAGVCRYKCDSTHTWENGSCINQKTTSCVPKPANSVWNDNGADGTYIQNWSSSNGWTPTSYATAYNTTAGTCRYKCDSTHTWYNSACVNQRTLSCDNKPENTVWNDSGANGKFTQNWSSSTGWTPAGYSTVYSTTSGVCHYTCDSTHTWENNSCINQKTASCSAKPENTVWNDNGANGTYTQNWSSSNGWTPSSYNSSYNTTAGVCRYKCDSTYTWLNGACINQKTASCSAKPENTVWNDNGANGMFTQNWSSSNGWTPASYSSSYSTTAGTCRYKCDSTHTWLNGACINQKTASCSAKPENTVWNDNGANGMFTQNWSSSNGWTPTSYSSSYNTTAGICRFKCDEHYNWNSSTSTCDPEVIQTDCPAKPANTVWNDNGANGKFDQTWTSSGWSPASYTSGYSTNAGICRYKCETDYFWHNSECVSPCENNTCADIANATGKCNASAWNEYLCECADGYAWNSEKCIIPLTLGNICTGQIECYDGSYKLETCPAEGTYLSGQDPQYRSKCSAPSFSSSSNLVIDKNTGLTWEKSPSSSTYTWDNRDTHCKDLRETNYAGRSNWRVPNNLEFTTIVDRSGSQATTYPNFTNMPTSSSDFLWTNKEYRGDTSKALAYSPKDAGNRARSKTSTYKVLCVSGNEMQYAVSSDFTISSDGQTVTDTRTNLVWQKEYATVSRLAWDTALSYCENLDYAGYTDWRLPNLNELSSLHNPDKSEAPYSYFPDMQSWYFWSSSSSPSSSTSGSLVNFSDSDTLNYTLYIRCVRAGLCEDSYFWNGSECVNPCDEDPCDSADHSICTPNSSDQYTCSCDNEADGYFWNGSECVNPCDSNPCNNAILPICTSNSFDQYTCSCYNVADGYFWNSSECVNPCDENPCNNVENSDKTCTPENAFKYYCGCESGYTWNGSQCVVPLGRICTGITSCYNSTEEITCPASSSESFFGQDAQYTNKCTAQSFAPSSNMVVDNNTGLTWEKSPSSSTYTWANANNHCNDLNNSNYGGINTWRVPNPLEFLTIVDNSNVATYPNFTNMPPEDSDFLWTSKEVGANTSRAHAFQPNAGLYTNLPKTSKYKVLCVSGNELVAATSSDFTTSSDGKVVTDSRTGLMWQTEYETNKTWKEALAYCQTLNSNSYGGYSDWRLPNKNELASLLDPGKSGAPYSNFPDMRNIYFWSSSTLGSGSGAWTVHFGNGSFSGYSKNSDSLGVRCVR